MEARPPSTVYRTSRWARRHTHLVRSVAAVLVVAVAALGVSTALLWKKDEQTQAARQRAEANLRNALAALDRVYLQVVEKRYPGQATLDKAEQALLQQVLGFYEQFARDNEAEAGVRFELARAYLRVGELRKRLAHDDWQSALARSADILRDLIRTDPREAEYRHTLALVCSLNGQLSEAATVWDRLSEEFPRHYEYRRRAVYARTRYEGVWKDAHSTYDLAKRLVDDFPGEPTARLHLGECLNLRGNAVWGAGPSNQRTCFESLPHYKDAR